MGVVVVNYHGGDLTLRCIESALRSDWPAEALEVVMVDNGSTDGLAERARRLARVSVVETGANLGFAGGCNVGIAELGGAVDYVALLNSDAVVEPGWLSPLVAALEADPALGAACPKILFDGAFVEVALTSEVGRRGFGDGRRVGVRLGGARVDGDDAWADVQLVSGFRGLEHEVGAGWFHWTDGAARFRVRARGDGSVPDVALLLSSPDGDRAVTLTSGPASVSHRVGPEPRWYDLVPDADPVTVVNNVGSALVDGACVDRGYLEPDVGQYEGPEEVFGWCGAAVVLSRRYLDSVGTFDDRYFLYYEDTDLSWRGRAQGWRYRYVPGPPVRHVHSASVVEGSRLHHHYNERNCMLTFARNAPARLGAESVVRHALVTGSYIGRDVVHPVIHGRRPSWERIRRHSGALASFVAALPWALASRRRLRARQVVVDDELLAWRTSPGGARRPGRQDGARRPGRQDGARRGR